MSEIKEVAIATWRLEKWLSSSNADKKMPAKSAIRAINSYLKDNKVEVQDLTGSHFDSGLNVDVINNETPDASDDELIISEMVKPIVLQDGSVISRGSVILGTTVKGNASEPSTTYREELVETETPEQQNDDLNLTQDEAAPDDSKANNPIHKMLLSIKHFFKRTFTKDRWNSCVCFIKKNYQWLLGLLLLLLLIITLGKVAHIETLEQVNLQNQGNGNTTTNSTVVPLPDSVEVTEDTDRNIYITINNKQGR